MMIENRMANVRNKWIFSLVVTATCILMLVPGRARADAMVVTRAMQATTIAEVFIEGGEIRVEFEIGAADIGCFSNLLPDEIYDKLGSPVKPLDERLQDFFSSDWQILADGQLLPGRLDKVIAAKRIVRDEVTGSPLTEQPEDAEFVLRVTLRYDLSSEPQSLTIHPPQDGGNPKASIGFVCYHRGLPINDFRYLPAEATLDLDWSDPWYTRFRHPNLRRQYDAPLSAYLYIEPYEVRKEIIVRPVDLQRWIDLGLRDDGLIPVDQQEDIKKRVVDFLGTRNSVTINGREVDGRLDRIHFIHRTLRATGIIEPAVDLDATSATLGVIFVYPVDQLPDDVEMSWELFSPKIQSIPAVASDEAGGLPSVVTPDDPVLVWKNFLKNPTSSELLTIAQPPRQRLFAIPIVLTVCLGFLVVMLILLGRQWLRGQRLSRPLIAISSCFLVVGLITLPFANVNIANHFSEQLSKKSAQEILPGLLYNVYRSFDHHDDTLIYDRLEKSVAGELIEDIYLETRKSMEVKNQGGLRISVKDVRVTELEPEIDDGAESTFRCRWRVSGWIGHWGHIHARANEHLAMISVAALDGRWKITRIDMIDEQTVSPIVEAEARELGSLP